MNFNTVDKGYEMKGVVDGIGHDLAGWKGTLYKDGKKVAVVHDDGYGGCIDFHWVDKTEKTNWKSKYEEDLREFIKNEFEIRKKDWKPKHDWETSFMFDEEIFVSDLVNMALKVKDLKKMCRKGVCVQAGDKIGSEGYRIYKGHKYKGNEDAFKQAFAKHFPNQEVFILNEAMGVN